MTTYALFIASDPDPVPESDWDHIDQVYDRARLSSGGTIVRVKATESEHDRPEDFDIAVATFINGHELEVRDTGPESFEYITDGNVVGTATLVDGEWQLVHGTDPETTASLPADGHARGEVQRQLGRFVEDWLT